MKTGIILRKNEKISIKREKIRKNTKKRFTISKKYVMMLGGILYPRLSLCFYNLYHIQEDIP
jgi:hypothetical protein